MATKALHLPAAFLAMLHKSHSSDDDEEHIALDTGVKEGSKDVQASPTTPVADPYGITFPRTMNGEIQFSKSGKILAGKHRLPQGSNLLKSAGIKDGAIHFPHEVAIHDYDGGASLSGAAVEPSPFDDAHRLTEDDDERYDGDEEEAGDGAERAESRSSSFSDWVGAYSAEISAAEPKNFRGCGEERSVAKKELKSTMFKPARLAGFLKGMMKREKYYRKADYTKL